jgi:uncharacterized protein (DUF1800 family)
MLPPAKGNWTKEEARHLLSRAGFGGSPDENGRFHAMGREKAVDFLLNPEESIKAHPKPEWADLKTAMVNMTEMMMERREMMAETRGLSAEEAEKKKRVIQKDEQQESRKQGLEAQHWWFNRMLKTKAPLREKMTLFWHDHFATSIQKVKQPVLLIKQNELFREYAFGNLRDLTQKIVRDPAMMLYLDTQRSSKSMPNENFAREVMELFTLGEGNYTEEDVKQAARAFTGYQLNRLTSEVVQSARAWDDGEKTIFGETGPYNGKDVVSLIFKKDACAKFMAVKLWEFFAYEKPVDSAMADLAATFRKNDYELKPVLREIFLSAEFYGKKAMTTQIKSPVQYLVQLLKELEMESAPLGFPIMGQTQLGQVLFMPPNVAGWDWGKAWINTNTLLTRYNLAGSLINGSVRDMMSAKKIGMRNKLRGDSMGPDFAKIAPESGRNETEKLVDELIARFFCVPIPAKARDSFIAYAASKKGVSFTDKELGELCHLMLSTPYYQLI